MRRGLVVALVVVMLGACGPDSRRRPASASMQDVLIERTQAALAAAAEHPGYPINRAQAALLDPEERGDGVRRAHVLLNAGQTQRAIDVLSEGDRATWTPPHQMLLGVAHLRLGEEANCLATDHAPEVCILPFRDAAVHADPAPARRAAALFRRVLDADSSDLDARWLLNIAHQAIGDYPEGVGPHLIPGLEADGFLRLDNVAPDRGVALMGLAGGVALDDFDGDGDLDLIATSWGFDHPIRYFVNDGRGGFTERTHEAGLDGLTGGLNLIHGDVDNDGDLDVLVLRGAWLGRWGQWPNSLLRNDGQGRFADVTFAAGLGTERPTQTAAFADVDGDGWLDLFVGNEGGRKRFGEQPSELYLNNRDGTFREVAQEAGVSIDAFVKGAIWTDADADGRPDLYLSVLGRPNRLFLNRSDGGRVRFDEAPGALGAAGPAASFPAAVLDWDRDGRDDLVAFTYPRRGFSSGSGIAAEEARSALGWASELESTRLYRSDGRAFADVTARAGLDGFRAPVMGVNVEDIDGDGWLDVYAGTGAPSFGVLVPNRLLMGGADGRFTDRTYASGTGHLQKGHAVSFGDLDGDLDPDLYVVAGGAYEADTAPNLLFENPWQDRGWVVLRLEGRQANRSAIGARVAVRLRDPDGAARTLWRTVGAGGSFGSNSLQLEVGVGESAVEAVEVDWPGSGTRDVFRGVARGGRYRLVEGADAPTPFSLTLDAPASPARPTHAGHGG